MKTYLLALFLLTLRGPEGPLPTTCLAQILTVSGVTDSTDKIVNGSCLDRKGQWVKHGEWYEPDPNPCLFCVCEHGERGPCAMPDCAMPSCSDYVPNPDECCDYTCVGHPGELGLWGIAILVALLLVIAGCAFAYYRHYQKRLAVVRSSTSDKKTGLYPTTLVPSDTSTLGLSNPGKKDEVEPITPPPSYNPPPYDDILKTETTHNEPNHQDV